MKSSVFAREDFAIWFLKFLDICYFSLGIRQILKINGLQKTEIVVAMQKLLYFERADRPDFEDWRTANATTICGHSVGLSVSTRSIHENQNNLSPFGRAIAIQVFHVFKGITADTATSDEDGIYVEQPSQP